MTYECDPNHYPECREDDADIIAREQVESLSAAIAKAGRGAMRDADLVHEDLDDFDCWLSSRTTASVCLMLAPGTEEATVQMLNIDIDRWTLARRLERVAAQLTRIAFRLKTKGDR